MTDVHGSSQDNFTYIVPEANLGIDCVCIIGLEHKYYVYFSVNAY
jgi:hypothetical protein